MSQRKYLRLAGFDPNRIPALQKKNAIILKIYEEMWMQADRMVGGRNGSLCEGITFTLLRAADIEEDVPREIVRACHRVQSWMRAISAKQCVLGRNNFLDALNVRQVMQYLTNADVASSPLGALSRILPPIL